MDTPSFQHILSIDIGGSNIKATILSQAGALTMDYQKLPTPQPSSPESILQTIKTLIQDFPSFDCISVGFPGYVKNGVVITAPNLDTSLWHNVNLKKILSDSLGKPAKVVNDADMQGLGVVNGKGFEIVVTLGTGFGTALLMDGNLLPHLEIAHHPIKKNVDYDQYIGEKALIEIGDKKWNKRVLKVIEILKTVFNYDHLYIGGGNAKKINFDLDANMTIVSNKDGIKGGARLWRIEETSPVRANYTSVQ
ncbi:MAG: chromosome partitioning protein ParA [Segetibacter sp.]|nr:chromosome partitioning protein ParA [Segetibacter sp.]